MTYSKFLPEDIPPWQMEFWRSSRNRNVKLQKCTNCGAYRYVPKEFCNRCQSSSATWEPVSGNGVVYSFTLVRRAPTPAYQADAPYTIVHVDMEEGVRMVGLWTGSDTDEVRIGLPVRLTYEAVTSDWTILGFVAAPAVDARDHASDQIDRDGLRLEP
jgi:uncharacterized protein